MVFIGGRGFHSNYGGVENATREISTRMACKGFKVVVYGAFNDEYFIEPNNLQSILCPIFFHKYLGQYGIILFAVLHTLFVSRPKVVFLFASGPCIFTPIIRLGGIKVVTSLRAIDSARDKWGFFSRTILRTGEYFAWRFSSNFTVNSKQMMRMFKIKRSDTIYIPNGVKSSEIINDRDLLDKHGLIPNQYLLFAARLDPVKRLHLLLEAQSSIPENQRLPLVVAGGNVKDLSYERKLKSLAPEGTVFLGHITQSSLDPLMQNCRAFLLPSILEGMSNSLLSAMSLSKAVLVADVPENKDVVLLTDAMFEADNVIDLKNKIIRLSTDKEFCKQLGCELGVIAHDNYNWDSTTKGFYDIVRFFFNRHYRI